MIRTRRSRRAGVFAATTLAGLMLAAGGCPQKVEPTKTQGSRYPVLPESQVQPYFKGTVKDYTLAGELAPRNVSGYGLVGQLRGTGDTTSDRAVRTFIFKEMARRGFGDANVPGFKNLDPNTVLNDPNYAPNYAIVRVDAFIPPGARREDFIDAYVSCLENNYTKSLLHGSLFEVDLRVGGADVDNPATVIHTEARAKGSIMTNPAFALEDPNNASGNAKSSLRNGTVLFNTRVMIDRPIILQLRKPQGSLARTIAGVIQYRFQHTPEGAGVARARDEGQIELFMPRSFRGDWERFVKLVQNFYLRADPETDTRLARELAEQLVKPDSPAEDISYALEGIGQRSLPHLIPLLNHADLRVSYWAARAAAYIGDDSMAAVTRLAQVARTVNHPFRLQAIRALGNLPNSASVNHLLKPLLDADEVLVRVEAYRMLAKNRAFPDLPIHPTGQPDNQKFMLDIIPGKGAPLIYASRTGKPRIAIIGQMPTMKLEHVTAAIDNRLTIAPTNGNKQLATLFFRDPHREKPVRLVARPSLDVIIARLAGLGPDDEDSLNFTYGEIVALIQLMIDQNRLQAGMIAGQPIVPTLVIQDPPRLEQDLLRGNALAGGPVGNPQFEPPPGVKPVNGAGGPQFGPATPAGPQFGPAAPSTQPSAAPPPIQF